MSIEFIDPTQTPGFYVKPTRPGGEAKGMVGFLIRRGLVNNETQANYLLLGLSAVFILITLYLIWGLVTNVSGPVKSTVITLEQAKEMGNVYLPAQ